MNHHATTEPHTGDKVWSVAASVVNAVTTFVMLSSVLMFLFTVCVGLAAVLGVEQLDPVTAFMLSDITTVPFVGSGFFFVVVVLGSAGYNQSRRVASRRVVVGASGTQGTANNGGC